VELQMGFGTGSHKNRISCDFRFEIGIAVNWGTVLNFAWKMRII
jgi:hypothetical protein